MSLPADLTTITVTGTFLSVTGSPVTQGQVNFGISTPVQDSTGKVILGVGVQSAVLNGSGSFSIVLPCTDNADLNPSGFAYLVTELVPGFGRAYYIELPHTLGATVDLSALAPVSQPPAASAFASQNTWTAKQTLSGNPPLQITTGAAAGDVLTSDAAGNAAWAAPASGWPGTTLGDTVYGAAGGAETRLAGNTTANKLFLTQAGTGTMSAAPAWGPVTQSDLATVGSPAPGRYSPLLYGAIWGWPWQFWADSYGAVTDGQVIADAAIASGNLNTLTSASGPFKSSDNGKTIMVNGGLGAATPLIATITYQNPRTVTLSTPAGQAVSAGNAIWGTDDTAAFQSMAAAMKTYGLAHDYEVEAVLIPGFTCWAGNPVQATGPTVNAQFPIYWPAANGTSQKLVAKLKAASGNASQSQYWESTIPNMQGACIVSMVKAPSSIDPTYGIQSVIGGPSGSGGLTGGFANTKVALENVTVWCPAMTNQYAMDFRYLGGASVSQCSAQAFASVAGSQPNLPSFPSSSFFQSRFSAGLYMPVAGNNADSWVDNFAVEGFVIGVGVSDTFTASKIEATYTAFGLFIDPTLGLSNNMAGIAVQNLCVGESLAAVHVGGGGNIPVYINLSTELITTAHVQDTSSALRGVIRWNDTGGGSPVVTGPSAGVAPANLQFINDNLQPGHWGGAPGVPNSTVAQQNTAWRDADIIVHTGSGVTVSAITVDGTVTGLTMPQNSSQVLPALPGGRNVVLTYAGGTPTWDWWLS